MNRKQVTVGNLAATSANNICLSQTPTSGTALTLNGTLVSGGVATLDTPRRVLLTFGNEAFARTLTITGTGWEGMPQTEVLTVAAGGNSTIQSALDYKTITQLMPGSLVAGAWSAAVTFGTGGTILQSSPWIALDPWQFPQVAIQIDVTGTITCTVKQSIDDPNQENLQLVTLPYQMTWVNHPDANLVGLTGNVQGNYAYCPLWTRIDVTSGGNAGANTATMIIVQAGPAGWR